MYERHIFSRYDGLLERPRVDLLFATGCKSSLITVLAGPGYGKTAAAAAYVKKLSHPVSWIRITRLDNITSRFWSAFISAFADIFSEESSRKLGALGFPDNMQKMDMFLHIFTNEIYRDNRDACILVVDDYHNIQDKAIRFFFESIVEANLENFTMMILSNKKTDIEMFAVKNRSLFQITAKDLEFTIEEAVRWFEQNEIHLEKAQIQDIIDASEGWPLALYFLALQYRRYPPGPEERISSVNTELAYQVFERDFFEQFDPGMRKLFIRLSQLPGFTSEICHTLDGGEVAGVMDAIRKNIFIAYDEISGLYLMQNMYRSFLREKKYELSNREQKATYQAAGKDFISSGHMMEAIECYANGGCYSELLLAIQTIWNTQMGMGTSIADYFLRQLSELPAGFVEENPLVDFLKASIYLNNLEIDRSYALHLQLRARLEGDTSLEARALLGEVYMGLGSIHMLRNREDFGVYFKKACECIPEEILSTRRDKYYIENNNNFSMQDSNPGALERMERAVHWGMPYMAKALGGGADGLQHLFSCEAAYLTNRMKDATQHAFRAVYTGQESGQADVVCNAYILLARISLATGRHKKTMEYIQMVVDFINERNLISLYDIRDYAASWLSLCTGKHEKISPWILGVPGDRDQPPITMGRDRLLYAHYLLQKEEYAELLALLVHLERLYQLRGLWSERLYVHILRAITHQKLKNNTECLKALKEAYDVAYQNHIILPFIEMGKHMRSVIHLAAQKPNGEFDKSWLETVGSASATFEKRTLALYRASSQNNGRKENAAGITLTPRELSVLGHMAAGLTREEIALEQDISINTVKKYISSIYNKLGAINRSDAIYLATVKGYLDAPV